MAKGPNLTQFPSNTLSVAKLNEAFAKINTAFENTISRDGSTPNSMTSDIDLNSNDILNVKNIVADEITVNGNTLSGSVLAAANSAADAALSAAQAALFDNIFIDDVTTLLVDTTLSYSLGPGTQVAVGDYIQTRAEGFSYEIAASGATDHHITTAGGVKLRVLPDVDGRMNIRAFGAVSDGVTDNTFAFTRAMATGRKIVIPEGVWYAASQITFTADHGGFEGVAVPEVDFSSNTFINGSVIKALITSNNLVGTTLRNIGVDTKLASLTEGIVITNFIAPVVENVIVLGSNENNHCCLMQAGTFARVKNFKSFGGKQGLAFKGTHFDIDGVVSYDTTVYGFTIRHDATPCYAGTVRNVQCLTNLLTRSGGFVAMNDDVDGSAMRDIFFENILVDTCNSGIFVLNQNNNTPARRLYFSNVILRNIPGFAFQTWGDTGEIDVDGITVENCSAAVYTNLATGNFGLNIRNLRDIDNLFASDISGSGHRFDNWVLDHPSRTSLVLNRSTDLQAFNMDLTVAAPITNTGGGTVKSGAGGVVGAAIGSLYAIRYDTALTSTVNQSMAQNSLATLFTMPDNFGIALVNVHCLSSLGRHVATYLVTGQVCTRLGGSGFQTSHFEVVVSGTTVSLKYIDATTRTVQARAFYSLMAQSV